ALEAIAAAFTSGGARLLDVHSDADHHRSVLTLVGADAELEESLLAGIAEAGARIDLREHEGVHPRVGAADVVPVIPLDPGDMARAAAVAAAVAGRVGSELGLPVFLYGESARGLRPAFFRRGGPAELQRRIDAGELTPDHGPRTLDPAAGAVLIGARRPLVAYNVVLDTADVEVARAIAAAVRTSSGGLPGVQALGVMLARRGLAQVSTNAVDLEATPLHELAERIRAEAAVLGVEVVDTELVGLLPASAVVEGSRRALGLPGLTGDRVVELRLLDR
ncbi:MAG: glutamate formimidoyltransferase, partial [Thermoleophilia bacterium]|nr:glutamate formimidoyltransferase [Thermoleophilia bacterium]